MHQLAATRALRQDGAVSLEKQHVTVSENLIEVPGSTNTTACLRILFDRGTWLNQNHSVSVQELLIEWVLGSTKTTACLRTLDRGNLAQLKTTACLRTLG
ncbi:hypothetical protein RRG08_057701 [Elysia crispata]|uniref:Uncharacterized protein n=1 Tax=Elysia crispata TaxID=231223 RepID=A0AAE1ALM4_9GAST|nr:hypothetical protein RRG08_057701 [Elysia crispata]